jgi:hypothetical protein
MTEAKVERCVAELIDALDDAASGFESAANGEGVNFFAYAEEARAAIAKARAYYEEDVEPGDECFLSRRAAEEGGRDG